MQRLTLAVLAATVVAATLPATAAPPSPETACGTALPVPTALVTVRPGAERWLRSAVAAAGGRVVGGLPPLHALEVAVPQGIPAAIRTDPRVRTVDVEQVYRALDHPADPMFGRQWALAKVGAPRAWNVETGTSAPVTVAVVDTGVDFGHPDLRGKLLDGFNVLAPGSKPQDDHTHGTHVSGIVAASTNNRVGVAGMSWAAQILPVKTLDANGSGTLCQIVEAVLYVASQHPDVANMSLAAPGPCPAVLQEALDLAYDAGVLNVAAAGNSGSMFNIPVSPANCDHTLAVAATDEHDMVAGFSNYGSYVDVSAPGVDILSTTIDPKKHVHGYAAFSGTSMAAPMVAGLAALIAARNPDWTPDQITAQILNTAVDLGAKGWDPHYGKGRIDAAAALR